MEEKSTAIKEVKLTSAILRFMEEDLLEVHTTAEYEMTKEDIVEINAAKKEFFGDKNYYIVVFVGIGSSATKEVRDFAAQESYRKNIVAEAIIISSLAARIMATLYMKFSRPKQVIRVVESKEEAYRWINSIRTTKNV